MRKLAKRSFKFGLVALGVYGLGKIALAASGVPGRLEAIFSPIHEEAVG